ncbi:hypothetical protein IAQ61_002657 [Plenodomus lingam]|uniref:uncharacterized protein n=1 Tax=Leptosphaeria maculans TaxID=5022 RepID=UPI00333283E2|nr:hypothetical protein IAQ61_002657 [Plenodomus lingam]
MFEAPQIRIPRSTKSFVASLDEFLRPTPTRQVVGHRDGLALRSPVASASRIANPRYSAALTQLVPDRFDLTSTNAFECMPMNDDLTTFALYSPESLATADVIGQWRDYKLC